MGVWTEVGAALASEFAVPDAGTMTVIVSRVACAAVLGGVIGWEREAKGRMTDIAILTPDPSAEGDHDAWRVVLDRLRSALSAEGITAMQTPWTAHVEDAGGLQGFARVLPLLAWGYHLDRGRWLRACEAWQRAGVPMSNPAGILAWNSDKRYLADLAARGVATPQTVWTRQVRREQLERMFALTGAEELIVKPSVSGGAWRTRRVHRDELAGGGSVDGDAGVDMLIQPYLPTIATEGETSLLFFAGSLSHAINKRPVPGDFRVQEEFGGRYAALPGPPPGALALAEQALAAIDVPLLYARIDVVPDIDGRWMLMEAELIEPDFYLGVDPQRGAGFARALARSLRETG